MVILTLSPPIDFDFDDEPSKPTNRGNKLKRKSEYFHEGELGGRRQYKKVWIQSSSLNAEHCLTMLRGSQRIDFAGHSRHIVHRNVPDYDHSQDLDDDEDDEAQEDDTSIDPYNGISIESK